MGENMRETDTMPDRRVLTDGAGDADDDNEVEEAETDETDDDSETEETDAPPSPARQQRGPDTGPRAGRRRPDRYQEDSRRQGR